MATRLQFPKGSTFSFLRQFVVDGAALDLTGYTLAAHLFHSPDDAEADALASLTIAATQTALGIVRITVAAADTAALARAPELYWRASATASAAVVVPETMHGPVRLMPALDLVAPACVAETLVPDDASELDQLATGSFLGIRADITSAALHRALATAGRTPLPWVIATLEGGQFLTWTLRARGSGENADADTYRLPDDYNASTNHVIWVKTALS